MAVWKNRSRPAEMRVYIPATLRRLADIVAAKEIRPAPLAAYAVTTLLRRSLAVDDEEELEFTATLDAAYASLRRLSEVEAPPCRVVLAADVDAEAVRSGSHMERAAVLLDRSVPFGKIASAHVDEPAAAPDVAAAAAALAETPSEGSSGDVDADPAAIHRASERELLWHARQEIPHLVEERLPYGGGISSTPGLQ